MYNRFRTTFAAMPFGLKIIFVVTAICLGVTIGILPIVVMSATNSVPVKPQIVIAEPTPISQPTILSVEEQTKIRDAIIRVWAVDETCYDEQKQFWFIHFPATKDDESDHWYFTEQDDIQMSTLGNGTVMILNPDILSINEVWPDVTGLNCTKHTIVDQ